MGLFNFNKKKKFISKLSRDQQDEILITLILMKQMIDADGVEKPQEKEYYKKYLINCGISSKEELESILDSADNLTSEQYDMVVEGFDEFQKLTILQELFGVICSDDEIDDGEIVLLFQISRDMGVDDDIVIDMLGAREDLFKKKNEKSSISNKEVEINQGNNHTDKVNFINATKKVDTEYIIGLFGLAMQMVESNDDKTESIIKIYTRIINEIPVLNGKSEGVVYTSENGVLNITFNELESKKGSLEFSYVLLEEIYFNRAQLYFKIGELEKAENDFQKAIDLNPKRNDATFYHHLGVTKFQLKRPIQDTLDCFNNSIKYNTKDDSFSLNLSDTYYMRSAVRLSNDDYLGAKKDIELAFELNSDDKAIIKLKSEINELVEENLKSKKDISGAIEKLDKFCSDCGEEFKINQKFCSNCGSKRKGIVKQVENDNLKSQLSKLVLYLEKITDSEKGDLYDYKYWFEQVVKRVDSHDIYYYNANTSSLDDQKQLANSHYDEYHHRMIEKNDDDKYKFITPRVESFLIIFKGISEISSISKEDKELYDRYYFHSKTSLYGAVKFLLKDTANGIEYLKEIFPEYDESMLDYDENELSTEMISKSIEILSPTVRIYLNKVLIKNAERFIDHKNSSAYDGLVKMIDSSLPIDSKKKNDEKKATEEIKNLLVDEKEYLNRIITAIIFYAKLQNWNLFITKIINELSNIDISIDEEFELEETESPLIDEWEKVEVGNEGDYILIKKNNQGVITHKKVYTKGKLQRFNLSKEKEELIEEEKRLLALLYYFFGVGDIDPEKVSPSLKNLSEKEFNSLIEITFWKIYNSYDDTNNLPALILNDYANFLYDNNLFSEGIHFATLAFNIEEKSSHADTVGEGYYYQEYFDMAFSSFSKAVEIDKKNDSHREEHVINYIKAALKTENLKSAQYGIDLLKENFTENKDIKNFEKELNSLISDTEEFKCPECGHIPKISQKFCTKCGTKFKEEDLQEDNYYENITSYLKAKNETLFLFVKEHIDISKKGKTYPEEVLIESITKFINKLKTDKELFRDVFDNKGNKKNNDENLNNMMFLTLYPKFFMSDDIETLAKVLNETESDKFEGYDDIEQYYSYYVYIRDFMFNESKKYMK